MGVRGFAVGLVAVGMAISAPAAGWAAPAGYTGVFAQWSLSPAAAPSTFAGTAAFAASAGMPATTVTTDSPTLRTPAGESAFLGASTGFGTYFGSSRSQPYLYLSPVSLAVPSTTTITFASVPPPGWGFAIGDIDADWMRVTGFDSTGVAVPSSALGAQDTGGTPLLNYCNNVPRPSSCVGPGPFTDHPSWLASGGVVNGTAYPPGTVLGNGTDSYGSYDWFLPDATVASITLEFHQIAGSPIYQLWLAALAPVSSISGSIVTPGTTDPVPAGTGIALQQPDGTPVARHRGAPRRRPRRPERRVRTRHGGGRLPALGGSTSGIHGTSADRDHGGRWRRQRRFALDADRTSTGGHGARHGSATYSRPRPSRARPCAVGR